MDRIAYASLYVRLPAQQGEYQNLTTFGSDFFGWEGRNYDLQLEVSELTRYINTRGRLNTLETVAMLLGENPNDVIITDSASQSLAIAITYARMHDLVCWIPRPWFPAYRTLPQLFGCKLSYYNPFDEEDALSLFDARLDRSSDLIIVNTPSNPLGISIPTALFRRACLASRASGSHVVWDLSYYWVEEPKEKQRLGGLRIYSLGKALGLPGMRLGAVVCSDEAVKRELEATKRQISLHSCPLSESAACSIINRFDVSALQLAWRVKLAQRVSAYRDFFPNETLDHVVGPFAITSTEVVSRARSIGISGEAFGLDSSKTRICLAAPEFDWNAFLRSAQEKGAT